MSDAESKPSFTPYRKWSTGLHVFILCALVLAVVGMVNFLSYDFFLRFHWSSRTKHELSPLTVGLLRSLTNQVKVTLYYDRNDSFYSTVASLLEEYTRVNPKFSVQTVDYLRDAGAAQLLAAKYPTLAGAAAAKDLVIFDCEGKVKMVPGGVLVQFAVEQVPGATNELLFERRPVQFLGEAAFTAALLDVTNPNPLNAYFLEGHGEHLIENTDPRLGYSRLKAVFQQYCISPQPLSLLGTNTVPMDCNLLVIAGPTTPIPPIELEKIDQYLTQGGRLFALFNVNSINKETGLEKILAQWGVEVGNNIIKDPEHTTMRSDVIVYDFSKHAIVSPLAGLALQLFLPRSISQLQSRWKAADAPRVEELAFTGPKAFAEGQRGAAPERFPLMVAVEKGAIKGVVTERGATRMVVVGDSLFLTNSRIDSAANRDFAGFAANWLLERTHLLKGVGARPVAPYKLVITQTEFRRLEWILLAGMPGAVLLFGSMIWLSRRR